MKYISGYMGIMVTDSLLRTSQNSILQWQSGAPDFWALVGLLCLRDRTASAPRRAQLLKVMSLEFRIVRL